jgi:hypothetical protein
LIGDLKENIEENEKYSEDNSVFAVFIFSYLVQEQLGVSVFIVGQACDQ